MAIGGWRARGVKNTKEASWFAVSLNKRTAPWAFQKGEAFRTIASLELLGVLVGLMVLVPPVAPGANGRGSIAVSCGTDNLGNTFLLDRGITTKHPLGVILMEVAHQCRCKRLQLRANWIPRLENQEADDLTNLEFKSFDPAKRLQVDLELLEFGVLNQLFKAGDEYLEEIVRLKALEQEAAAKKGDKRRKKASESLREKDPWQLPSVIPVLSWCVAGLRYRGKGRVWRRALCEDGR